MLPVIENNDECTPWRQADVIAVRDGVLPAIRHPQGERHVPLQSGFDLSPVHVNEK